MERGTIVWDRAGTTEGFCTGSAYPCRMEGCAGERIGVRWPDGQGSRVTFPCTKGIIVNKAGAFQIG